MEYRELRPLPPDDALKIWRALKPFNFKATYGVMAKVTDVCKFLALSMELVGKAAVLLTFGCLRPSRETGPITQSEGPRAPERQDRCEGHGIL